MDSPVTNAGIPLPPNPLRLSRFQSSTIIFKKKIPHVGPTYRIAVNFDANSPIPPVLLYMRTYMSVGLSRKAGRTAVSARTHRHR